MPPKIVSEIRFREGTGTRYMSDGSVRCHAQSKGKLRKWREANDDYETPNDEIWPQCQCEMPATVGSFCCHWHGGETPSKNKPKNIFDVMPIDLAEKLKTLMEHPEYISQREDINLMQARKWELLEDVQKGVGGEEAWGMVADALALLKQGKLLEAMAELEDSLNTHITKKEAWAEIKQLEKIVDRLRGTEVKSAKELKLMATADQVAGLINHMYNVVSRGIDKYMRVEYMTGYGEKRAQADFSAYVADEIFKSANIAPVTLGLLAGVTGEENA